MVDTKGVYDPLTPFLDFLSPKAKALKGENDLPADCTAKELGVGVLENQSHVLEELMDRMVPSIFPQCLTVPTENAAIEMGNQSVEDIPQCRFTGSARPANQEILSLLHIQAEIIQNLM